MIITLIVDVAMFAFGAIFGALVFYLIRRKRAGRVSTNDR